MELCVCVVFKRRGLGNRWVGRAAKRSKRSGSAAGPHQEVPQQFKSQIIKLILYCIVLALLWIIIVLELYCTVINPLRIGVFVRTQEMFHHCQRRFHHWQVVKKSSEIYFLEQNKNHIATLRQLFRTLATPTWTMNSK